MIASDRLLRWLCWGLIGSVIVSAAATLTLSVNPFSSGVPDGTDFVDRLLIYRGDDAKIYPLVLIGSLATIGVFVLGAMLGAVLRRFAPAGAAADVMAVVFIVGGVVGVTSALINIGVTQAATNGFCDCGYKAYEVIGQGYALEVGWAAQNWLNTGAIVIVGIGAAIAGRVVGLSRDWRILSYLIALALLIGVALRLAGVYQGSDMVVGLTAAIMVPIWAYILSRHAGRLTERA